MTRTSVRFDLTRRQILRNAGGLVAGAAFPVGARAADAAQAGAERPGARADVTGVVARYMAQSRERAMPPDVTRQAKHRILDTIAAMISGSRLKPGELAIRYARAQGGVAEASVVATSIRTSAVTAALANGMFAHADETDDFEPFTKAHPGCAVVPAALAVAERHDRSGLELLNGVILGYDVCCRWLMALGPAHVRATHRSVMDPSAPRSGNVEVVLRDGTRVSHFTKYPPGTKESPLDTAGVNAKARSLIAPVLGAERAEALIRRLKDLEAARSVRELVRLLV